MREREEFQKAVGERIRQLRKARGMTLSQLAEAADISIQYLSELEYGKKAMTIGKLVRITAVLGVSTDRLLLGERGGDHTKEELARLIEDMTPLDREMVLHTLRQSVALLDAAELERT